MARKFNFGQIIKKGDAKQRILLIIVVITVLILVLFLVSKLINFNKNSTGDSQVGSVPRIASVQGGKVSPEYERALNSSNIQKAAYAKSTGTSSVATIINTGESDVVGVTSGCTNCCNTCGSESTDQLLSQLMGTGKISSSTADLLNELANQNLSPEDYEAALAQMVREGKISPEEARRLLAAYKQHYQEKIAAAGAKDLDPLVKQGLLSVGAASELLDLQKQPASSAAYDQALANMANSGQMSAATAALLQQKYQEQQQKRQAEESAGQLLSMETAGGLSHEAASMLAALQASDLSVGDYAKALEKAEKEGKISPELAQRLLAQYNKQHGGANANLEGYPSGMELSKEQGDTLKSLQRENTSVDNFAAKLEQYARAGEISADTASRLLTAYQTEYSAKQILLTTLNQAVSQNQLSQNVSTKIQALMNGATPLDQFTTTLGALNTQGLLSTAQMNILNNAYARVKTAADAKDQLISTLESKPKLPSDAAQKLTAMRSGAASLSDYASELQRLVDAGLISPETARALLEAYKKQFTQNNMQGNGAAFSGLSGPAIDINLSSSGNAKLDRIAQSGLSQQAALSQQRKDYTAAVAFQQQNQQAEALQQTQIQQLSDRMYTQAQQLFGPMLTPTAQTLVYGSETTTTAAGGLSGGGAGGASNEQATGGVPIIKAGTVLYGVLDTAVDSDYADSPVMATIVSGQYRGAKLLGSIKTVKDGQRVMLTFNLMTMNDWPKGIAVNAFAIDPDSARSAVATSVDNHYMLRYGTAFAASFLQGLGQAVQESGTTVSSDSGVVTQSTSNLNTEETILVALGQVGQNASAEVAKLQNTPPTVKIKAGIGIGVLFMSDVSAVQGVAANAPGSGTTAQPAVQGY